MRSSDFSRYTIKYGNRTNGIRRKSDSKMGQRLGEFRIDWIALSISSMKAAGACSLRSAYQATAASASARASGWISACLIVISEVWQGVVRGLQARISQLLSQNPDQ